MVFSNFASAAASVPSPVAFFFWLFIKLLNSPVNWGWKSSLAELCPCLKPKISLEGLWGRGDDQSVCKWSAHPGSWELSAPVLLPIHQRGERGQQKRLHWAWCLLNLSGRFCRHGSFHKWGWEHGSFPSQQPHMATSLDNGRRFIGALWPHFSPTACSRISARGWERPEALWYWSCSPLIIIPADLHQVPLTHQPSPNNSAIDSPCSFVPSSKPACWNPIWYWVTRSGGRRRLPAHLGTCGKFCCSCHDCTSTHKQHNLDEFPCLPSILCSAGKRSIKTGSRSLPVYHLLPSSSLQLSSLQLCWDPTSTPAMKFLYLVFAVFLLVSLATPGKMANRARWADTSWDSFKVTLALENIVITIWGDCYNLARYFNDFFQGTMK